MREQASASIRIARSNFNSSLTGEPAGNILLFSNIEIMVPLALIFSSNIARSRGAPMTPK